MCFVVSVVIGAGVVSVDGGAVCDGVFVCRFVGGVIGICVGVGVVSCVCGCGCCGIF